MHDLCADAAQVEAARRLLAGVRGPQGHHWWIHQRIEDVAPEEATSRLAHPAAQAAMEYEDSLVREPSSPGHR